MNIIRKIYDKISREPLLVKPVVSLSFTLNEIGDKCQKWLDEEIAKDPKDQFSNREKYWMHEAYTAGFNEAIKICTTNKMQHLQRKYV